MLKQLSLGGGLTQLQNFHRYKVTSILEALLCHLRKSTKKVEQT